MTTIPDSQIPSLFDIGLNGVGYLIEWSVDSNQSLALRGIHSYMKQGEDLLVERNDFVQEMSENKIDGLFWSSQRSWWEGQGQSRADTPGVSTPERYLRSKNVDPFTERGALRMSEPFVTEIASIDAGTTDTNRKGVILATPTQGINENVLHWSGGSDPARNPKLYEYFNTFGGAGYTTRDVPAGNGEYIQALASDGSYVYALTSGSAANTPIFRGVLTTGGTALTSWFTAVGSLVEIAFVKERIMAMQYTTAGALAIYEITTAAAPANSLTHQYELGWHVPSLTRNIPDGSVFTEVQGYVAWIANRNREGTVWLWDGTNNPFMAARFPCHEAQGIFSYDGTTLYVVVHDRDGGKFSIVRCDVSAGGSIQWDILHTLEGTAYPRFALAGDGCSELMFSARLAASEINGLTSDSGVTGGTAPVILSLSMKTEGLAIRYWGLTTAGGATTGILHQDTGFARPALAGFNAELAMVGERSGIRRTDDTKGLATAEVISSGIDYNIDSNKRFLMFEAGFDPLVANAGVTAQYSTDSPLATATPTWTTIATGSTLASTLLRSRITSGSGFLAPRAYYRLQLTDTGISGGPVIRKAGLGASYGLKPTYTHQIAVRAFDYLKLNNRTDHPNSGSGLADSIQSALESLRDTTTVVDFQEPRGSTNPRTAVKVRVAAVTTFKRFESRSGFSNLCVLTLKEVPS